MKHKRRKWEMCWSCSTWKMVRERTFWTTGMKRLLCADCEKQFTLLQLQ